MNETTLQLDRNTYAPGDTLVGVVSVAPDENGHVQSVTVAVYWSTEGKGDVDRGEIFRRVYSGSEVEGSRLEFRVPLPGAPMSYDGVIVKIRWFAEVRVRYQRHDASLLVKLAERLMVPTRRIESFRLGEAKSPKELAP